MGKRRLQPTAAIPIVEQIPVVLDADEKSRLTALAARLLADEPALNSTAAFGANVAAGCLPVPCVVIEDHSAIALFSREQLAIYDYRALLLAGTGDVLLVGTSRNEIFERYCREFLGLGKVDVEVVRAPSLKAAGSLALYAADDVSLVARLAARARQSDGLNLIPYMGTGGVWSLAGRLAAVAHQPIRVAAPPPRLTRRVNDKAWFARRVGEVLGPSALPPSEMVYGRAALAARVARFARHYPSVAVKVADSASSAGNLVLDAAELGRLSLRRLYDLLFGRLADMGWPGTFPLVVTAWERPLLASPSVQLWIPDPSEGTPIVEGVFDQMVVGRAAVFSGAVPSAMPRALLERAAAEAVRLGVLFQGLGYFGRCSLDAVLVGSADEAAELHWVECNGRWGGVSTPMTLANRLTGDWTLVSPAILDRVVAKGQRRPLGEVLQALEDELYRPGGPAQGGIFLSPERVERGWGFQMMVLDSSAAAVRARAQRLESRLVELISAPPAAAQTA